MAQWGSLTYSTAGTTHLTSTRALDSTGLASYMGHKVGATMFQSFDYYYDRDRVTKTVREKGNAADETAWLYGYDAKGQVLSADKKFSTAGDPTGKNFLAGYQTQYTYDEAGNRLTKDEGGSATATEGTGVRQTGYPLTNALNQYENMRHPDAGGQKFDVLGRRSAGDETITVNGSTATYQDNAGTGLHFSRTVSFTAPAGSSYASTNLGTYGDFTASSSTAGLLDSGKVFLPHPYEAPAYDADGNLRTDSRWTYAWDAENRLTQLLTRHTPSVSAPAVLVSFGYDGLSRRIWKMTRTATNPAAYEDISLGAPHWTTISHEAYLYDGWNLLMRVSLTTSSPATATARQSFVWGPDIGSRLTGHNSWQKAGGVGGLLMVLDTAGATGSGDNFFPTQDRMGNILGYRRANTGSPVRLSAVFEYDAFGRELKSLGEVISAGDVFNPDTLPFRFSTKFTDVESGLLYYGFRFYDPVNGRWLNRDPIGEDGGLNILGAANNNLVASLDVNGLRKMTL